MTSEDAGAAARPIGDTGFVQRAGLFVLLLLLGVALTAGLWKLRQVLLLVLAGLLLGIALTALVRATSELTGLSRGWAFGVVLVVISSLVIGGGVLTLPYFTTDFGNLSREVRQSVSEWSGSTSTVPGLGSLKRTVKNSLEKPKLQRKVVRHFFGYASSAAGALGSALFVVVLGIYFSATPSVYESGCLVLFPQEHRRRAKALLKAIREALERWMKARCISMAVVAIATSCGLWLLGIPHFIALGILAGICGWVPNIGPAVAAIPALALSMSSATGLLPVAGLYAVIQLFESYLLTPALQKRAVSIPPALLLVSQLAFGVLFGFLGLVLATPLTAVAVTVVKQEYLEQDHGH